MASQSQSQFSAPASLSSSQPTAQKKERQTRIPEHLKTVKRSSSSSNSSSSSSSSASLAGHRKHRAASPKKNLRKLEAVIEAQSQQAQRDSATNTADSRNANTQQRWVFRFPFSSFAFPSSPGFRVQGVLHDIPSSILPQMTLIDVTRRTTLLTLNSFYPARPPR